MQCQPGPAPARGPGGSLPRTPLPAGRDSARPAAARRSRKRGRLACRPGPRSPGIPAEQHVHRLRPVAGRRNRRPPLSGLADLLRVMGQDPADHVFLAGRRVNLRGREPCMPKYGLDVGYLEPSSDCLLSPARRWRLCHLPGGCGYLLPCPARGSSGGAMFVQRVAMPTSRVESWTVLGDDDTPVEPIERYLTYLSAIEKSPNTVKAYAHDLKDYWVFLARRDLDWREVRLEDIGEFIAWLRLPPE